MLDIAEAIVASALQREESRGAHQRTDFPAPGRRAVPGPLAGRPQPDGVGRVRVPAGDDHPLAAGERVYGGGWAATDGRLDYAAGRARYRPEEESEPTFEDYEVPLRKDWVVLDGLNHIKDQIDGTLSYRWSCRMGICGSCGMTGQRRAQALTCATFLDRLRAGPGAGRAAAQLPGHPRPGRRPRRLHEQADAGQAVDRPQVEKPVDDGEYRQTPEELDDYKQFSMCINCMLCYSACPIYGSTRISSGRRRSRSPSATTSTPATRAPPSGCDVLSEHDGIWGCTFVGECTKVCPKHVDPAAAIQRYKLQSALDWVKAVVLPRGA